MIAKWLKSCFLNLSEACMVIDDMFRRRSLSKKSPFLTDGEFYSCFNYDDNEALKDLKEAYKERDFEAAAEELIRYCTTSKKKIFLFNNPEVISKIKKITSPKKLIKNAELICRHNIIMPTGHSADFGTFINWFSDFNGKNWMYGHVSEFLKKVQDKLISKQFNLPTLPVSIEFNKHSHFVELARAFLVTSNERYTQEFILELEEWVHRNPIHYGISWIDPMAVAQRMISWMISIFMFIGNSSYLQGEHLESVIKNILLHGAYLFQILADKNQRPSRYIAASSALYIFSCLFPEFDCVDRWKSKALRTLENESSVQFLADGVYRERSLGMQVLLTEFLMLPLIIDKISNVQSSPAILSVVERSLEFLIYTLTPYGNNVNFGDTPATHVWNLSLSPQDNFKNLLCIGAYLFNRGDMKFASGDVTEDFIWFFGEEGEEIYKSIVPKEPEKNSRVFIDGGYFSFRDSWTSDSTYCLFYGNSKKPSPPPDKGINLLSPHKDFLSFALYVRGEPFIIETGSYKGAKQFGTDDIYSYFNKTTAHNSVLVDGKEQSLAKNIKGSRKYMHLLKTRWLFSDDFDYVMSGHAGFDDVKNSVIHRREILYLKSKKWFIIRDTIEGSDVLNVTNTYNLSPELDISLRGDYGCLIHAKREYIRLNMYYPGPFECKQSRGKIEPNLSGWYSKSFNRVDPCYKIEYSSKIQLPCQIYTWISWARGEFRIPPKSDLEEAFDIVASSKGIMEDELQFETPEK